MVTLMQCLQPQLQDLHIQLRRFPSPLKCLVHMQRLLAHEVSVCSCREALNSVPGSIQEAVAYGSSYHRISAAISCVSANVMQQLQSGSTANWLFRIGRMTTSPCEAEYVLATWRARPSSMLVKWLCCALCSVTTGSITGVDHRLQRN